MSNLCQIVYCSRSLLKGSKADVEAHTRRILALARVNNKRARVTGALAFNEFVFAQILEGATSDVMPIFDRIRADTRHCDLKILSQAESPARMFPSWSMAYVSTPHGDGRHPLANFDFETALTDGTGPQAELLLTCLRQVVTVQSKPRDTTSIRRHI